MFLLVHNNSIISKSPIPWNLKSWQYNIGIEDPLEFQQDEWHRTITILAWSCRLKREMGCNGHTDIIPQKQLATKCHILKTIIVSIYVIKKNFTATWKHKTIHSWSSFHETPEDGSVANNRRTICTLSRFLFRSVASSKCMNCSFF